MSEQGPVAWAVVDKDGEYATFDVERGGAEAYLRAMNRDRGDGPSGRPYTLVPLYAVPSAPAVDVEKVAAEIRRVVNAPETAGDFPIDNIARWHLRALAAAVEKERERWIADINNRLRVEASVPPESRCHTGLLEIVRNDMVRASEAARAGRSK